MIKLIKIFSLCAVFTLSPQVTAFELVHSQGTIKLDSAPEAIITYDPAVLDSLDYLGIKVVGMPELQDRSAFTKYADIKTVGTLFEPDFDALNELKPELIFVGRRNRSKSQDLTKVAPVAHYSFNYFHFLDDFKNNNLHLAKAFNKEAEAKEKLAIIEKDIKELHAINKNKTGVFLMISKHGRISPQPEGALFGFVYELFGLTSVLESRDPDAPRRRPRANSPQAKAMAKVRAQQITNIANANPDWLIVFDRHQLIDHELKADKVLQAHPELGQIDALKQNRVMYVDPDKWYLITGGLNNVHQIVKAAIEQMK